MAIIYNFSDNQLVNKLSKFQNNKGSEKWKRVCFILMTDWFQVKSPRRLVHIQHEHGDGQRSDTARNRRNEANLVEHVMVVHVATNQLSGLICRKQVINFLQIFWSSFFITHHNWCQRQ